MHDVFLDSIALKGNRIYLEWIAFRLPSDCASAECELNVIGRVRDEGKYNDLDC
jgi:hypothetical protein